MPDIVVHTFQTHQVRTLTSPSGEPLFVLSDVCQALGISNSRMVAQRLDPDGVSQADTIDSLGRPQKANVVNEAGLYEVIRHTRTDLTHKEVNAELEKMCREGLLRDGADYGFMPHMFLYLYLREER